MKRTHLLTCSFAALLVTGSAFACPKKDKAPSPGSEEGIYEVADREGDGEAREGKRERGERPERSEGDRKRPERGDHSPLKAMNLTDDQKEQVETIMTAARKEAKAVMDGVKAKKEAGEEVDRDAVRTQMMEIRKGAMKNVYDNVLTAEQQAKMDELRKKMEEHRKEREGKDGERPERKGKGEGKAKGEKKDRGGDSDLDL